MTQTHEPRDEQELVDLISQSVADRQPLELIGQASKRQLGAPLQAAQVISTAALSGVSLYEPEELVLSAGAGTPMTEIAVLLAQHNQQLAFDPIDYAGLFGSEKKGTLGGVISCNLSGSKRLRNGAARDHILGVRAVSGRGELFKSGGRVVKNVTGYDLAKVVTGAFGTLAAISEITVKVLPLAETEISVLMPGVNLGSAIRAMADAMGSVNDLSAAAYLPAAVAAAIDLPEDTVMLRLEGFGASIKYRAEQVASLVSDHGSAEMLEDQASTTVWTKVRDVAPFWSHGGAVWRLSIAPGDAPQLIAQLQQEIDLRYYLDWQGGLAWLAVPEGEDAAAGQIRRQVNVIGGHATLVKASAQCRAHVPAFHPQSSGLAALSGRLKSQFDPENILNPGRMGAF